MNKKAPSLQAALDSQDTKPVTPKRSTKAASTTPKKTSKVTQAKKRGGGNAQGSREGKVAIIGYFVPEARKQLAIMAIEQETSQQDLMAEALNDLFRKYGKSRIA